MMRGTGSVRFSRINRSRDDDLSPIVHTEDNLYDEELETMEQIGEGMMAGGV